MTRSEISDFLLNNGFKIVESVKSKYFGDYFEIFSNSSLDFRFRSSKSFEMVDIKFCNSEEKWFDLILVKALLFDEKDLLVVTGHEACYQFLKEEFFKINELFNETNYSTTKVHLDELGKERARQMFPGINI